MDYDITKPKVAISDRFSTYTNWTCLICGALYCQTHGDYREETIEHSEDDEGDIDRPQKPKYNNIHQLLIMDYNDLLRKQDARLACKSQDEPEISRSIAEPCSKECYRIFDRETAKDYQVSPEQRVKIESMCISLQEHPKRPCDISFVLGLPCWQVDREIRTQIVLRKIGLPPGYIPTKKPDWYDNKRKILKDHWQDHTNAHLHQERWQSLSCSHDGPCDKRCPCFSANLLCESFCGCPDDCARKWTGCACHSSGKNCQTETCICIQMNRECGPQCMSCGAIPRIKAFNKYNDELFTTGCQNVFIQRGVPKKMIIGESQLVGFGLYLAEPVRKGQYLSEYTGEVIAYSIFRSLEKLTIHIGYITK
jgi:histone-lysine N-methyltransferase EZH2